MRQYGTGCTRLVISVSVLEGPLPPTPSERTPVETKGWGGPSRPLDSPTSRRLWLPDHTETAWSVQYVLFFLVRSVTSVSPRVTVILPTAHRCRPTPTGQGERFTRPVTPTSPAREPTRDNLFIPPLHLFRLHHLDTLRIRTLRDTPVHASFRVFRSCEGVISS